jgi:hypothetical protein
MICHKHKFIFVHINKTAGTSLEWVLMKHSNNRRVGKRKPGISLIGRTKHRPVSEYKIIADKIYGFKNYFKFTLVRNPWQRLLSNYFFRKYKKGDTDIQKLSFTEWVKNSNKRGYLFENCLSRYAQLDWITDENGEVCVDFIGRFENLQEDFNTICDKIGIPRNELPHKNATKHKHYTEYYDDESIFIVAEKYAKDIEYFGYKFGE